jgi:Cu(I)/Ag(I) efflux system membrane fusion protein
MKIYFLPFVCFIMIALSCNQNNKTDESQISTNDLYTCSMHPQVLEHHPGNCPICGMKLVKKNTSAVAINNIELESLLKPANQFVVASLPVTTPQQKSVSVSVEAYGTIEYDPVISGTISARVSGRIEKLYLRYRYQQVKAGQKIMDIYSPELLTAQQNLLFLLKNDADNTSFIKAAKQKLLLLGMSETELNKVINTGKPLYSVGIYSNYSGHIHDASMGNQPNANEMSNTTTTEELSLKEGMYVQKGQSLFMVMNHHMAWAALQIFSNDQSIVKKGDAVQIIPQTDTARIIDGRIDFIEAFFRNNSKTLTARVNFHNMSMLPIGSQVTANIFANSKKALWLPQSAVLSLGINNVVFVKNDGGFIAHKVTAGVRSNTDVEIVSGLTEKDTVAANAQYLVDSESFIQASSK